MLCVRNVRSLSKTHIISQRLKKLKWYGTEAYKSSIHQKELIRVIHFSHDNDGWRRFFSSVLSAQRNIWTFN